MVGVSGVSWTWAAGASLVRQRVGRGHVHGLDVGRVATGGGDEGVLTVLRDGQELLAGRATHGPGGGVHDDVLEAEPVEDLDVRVPMGLVRLLQPDVVDVEGVGVLHHELAAAQQPGAGPRLVPVLGLDLVERQRQVLVRGVQVLDQQGEHLLVGGTEQVVTALAVLQPEDVGPVVGPATGRVVRLLRQQGRQVHLLGADGVHLLADDPLDVAQHLVAQRQPAVDPRSGAADVAGAHQPAVAGHLGVGRVVAQGPDEELRHAGDHCAAFLPPVHPASRPTLSSTSIPGRAFSDHGRPPRVWADPLGRFSGHRLPPRRACWSGRA